MKVFLSYSTKYGEIDRYTLLSFKKILIKLYKCEIYVDLIDNQNNEDPQSCVEQQLKGCQMLILIDDSNAIKSEWVRKEIKIAKRNCIDMYSIDIASMKVSIESNDEMIVKNNLKVLKLIDS